MQVRPQGGGTPVQSVQTSPAKYPYDEISTVYTNAQLSLLKTLTFSVGSGSNAAYVQTDVESIIRIPNVTTLGDGSIVIFFTSLGRIILNGSELNPAVGEWEQISNAELYQTAMAQVNGLTSDGKCCELPSKSAIVPNIDNILHFVNRQAKWSNRSSKCRVPALHLLCTFKNTARFP